MASVLIENAKLTAELEGTRQLIAEVRDDKEFLREELKEANPGEDTDCNKIAPNSLSLVVSNIKYSIAFDTGWIQSSKSNRKVDCSYCSFTVFYLLYQSLLLFRLLLSFYTRV